MEELTQVRLVVAAVVTAIAAAWWHARLSDKRRERRFVELGRSLGAQVERESEFLSRFPIELDGRVFEVTYQHIGGPRAAVSGVTGWYLVTTTALHGVSALHSAEIRPRSDGKSAGAAAADDFVVRDRGYPLQEGWLTPATAQSLGNFFAAEVLVEYLDIEEGKLVQRSRARLSRQDGPRLLDLLFRQGALASQLERSL